MRQIRLIVEAVGFTLSKLMYVIINMFVMEYNVQIKIFFEKLFLGRPFGVTGDSLDARDKFEYNLVGRKKTYPSGTAFTLLRDCCCVRCTEGIVNNEK